MAPPIITAPVNTAPAVATEPTVGSKMNPTIMALVRYALIGTGMFLAGRGIIKTEDVATIAEQIMPAIGAVITACATLWGVYVSYGTRQVPLATAQRADVPTVSSVTGAIEPPQVVT